MSVSRGIHWQLVWFSCVALTLGVAYSGLIKSAAPMNRQLPKGLGELPHMFLAILAGVWLALGVAGLIVTLGARRGHSWVRAGIGIMFGTWAGAYFYGWAFGGDVAGWIGAGLYGYVGLAVVTPPVWLVKIKSKSAGGQ